MKRLAACAGDSKLARLSCICVVYCIGCIERCVRYLSRNAYVLTMLNGTPFCTSAGEALSLLTKHALKVSLARSIGSAFLLLGKIFVLAACAAVGAIACSPALTLAPHPPLPSLSLSRPHPASPAPSPSPRLALSSSPRTSRTPRSSSPLCPPSSRSRSAAGSSQRPPSVSATPRPIAC